MAKRKTPKKAQAPKTAAPPAPLDAPPEDEADVVDLRKIFDDAAKLEEGGWGLKTADVECPHCGEEFELSFEPQDEGQELIQDCQVCCRPITFAVDVDVDDGEVSISAYRD
ncbi:MAG: CPXCG motif-containing cysteine-rich protein [Elusimicrobiota bacterium]